MRKKRFIITKWCRTITEDGKDLYVNKEVDKSEYTHKFRLLDDDDVIYCYGLSKDLSFEALDYYQYDYGVTGIQYKDNETGDYKFL